MLKAWFRLGNSIPLRIVGDGPLQPELAKFVEREGLSSVLFMGRLDRKKTQEAIKSAIFLILPSVCYENFPMTIVEAFAAGTPVICSRLGAMQEIVTDHHTGLHFEAGSSEHLADRVAWGWSHAAQMRTMGRAARQEFETKYTAQTNHDLLMDIYRMAMNRTPKDVERRDWRSELVAASSTDAH